MTLAAIKRLVHHATICEFHLLRCAAVILGRAVETAVAAMTIREIAVWLNLAAHSDGCVHRCSRLAEAQLWLGTCHIPTRSCMPKTNGNVQRDMQTLPHEIA